MLALLIANKCIPTTARGSDSLKNGASIRIASYSITISILAYIPEKDQGSWGFRQVNVSDLSCYGMFRKFLNEVQCNGPKHVGLSAGISKDKNPHTKTNQPTDGETSLYEINNFICENALQLRKCEKACCCSK